MFPCLPRKSSHSNLTLPDRNRTVVLHVYLQSGVVGVEDTKLLFKNKTKLFCPNLDIYSQLPKRPLPKPLMKQIQFLSSTGTRENATSIIPMVCENEEVMGQTWGFVGKSGKVGSLCNFTEIIVY